MEVPGLENPLQGWKTLGKNTEKKSIVFYIMAQPLETSENMDDLPEDLDHFNIELFCTPNPDDDFDELNSVLQDDRLDFSKFRDEGFYAQKFPLFTPEVHAILAKCSAEEPEDPEPVEKKPHKKKPFSFSHESKQCTVAFD